MYYILDEYKKPTKINDVIEWAKWFEDINNRVVAKDQIGEIKVSTVFLGIDHNYISGGIPILFETMIFGGNLDEDQWRYHTWEKAEDGHKNAVELVKAEIHINKA